ncbi:GTP 3',8-cyclase MoaA [Aestuariimicrobium ganziense]|uniref:GTP 3',8-cyclase MoaA n=1 Tax=Aestuariimicrobium ganziense TaxID=2773677 RepID=UPI0019413097|nr:GTP 3',8-cyclase MoaA [Aestuariimicrobium ganziense]
MPASEVDTETGLLTDSFGRTARDLRVSLTDRCNLRCSYCMPAEGLPWLPDEQTLTDDEVLRLLAVAVERLGVRKLRFTGGEPLLRASLERLVAGAHQLVTHEGRPPEITLTTNGLGLDKRLSGLVAAGLDRVNVSLDSLDRQRYAALTRRDRLPDVLASLRAVEQAGLTPIKVNAVIMREVNTDDIVPLATFALERGYQLRYIEQMPLGPKHSWDRRQMVTAAEILEALGEHFTLTPLDEPRGAAPAELWQVHPTEQTPGGIIGVIASVSAPFCGSCDRTRITSDGQVRNCLFSQVETDLRGLLRRGATDDELALAWRGSHLTKGPGHGIDLPGFHQPDRPMSAIGG